MLTTHSSGSPSTVGAPGHLVALDPARDNRGAGQVAPVVPPAGLDAAGPASELSVSNQTCPFAPTASRSGLDRDPHRLVEPVEGEADLALGEPDRHELAGLVGRDQQRAAHLAQDLREGGAVMEARLAEGRAGRLSIHRRQP